MVGWCTRAAFIFLVVLFKAAGNLRSGWLAPLGHVRVQRRVCLQFSAPSATVKTFMPPLLTPLSPPAVAVGVASRIGSDDTLC